MKFYENENSLQDLRRGVKQRHRRTNKKEVNCIDWKVNEKDKK